MTQYECLVCCVEKCTAYPMKCFRRLPLPHCSNACFKLMVVFGKECLIRHFKTLTHLHHWQSQHTEKKYRNMNMLKVYVSSNIFWLNLLEIEWNVFVLAHVSVFSFFWKKSNTCSQKMWDSIFNYIILILIGNFLFWIFD